MTTKPRHDVTVVGQIARDLVLVVDEVPEPLSSAPVRERRETLGGKGANQAVSMAQLGASVALVGVLADDADAERLLDRARADGIDTGPVVRRRGGRSALIVDIVDRHAHWRYLEDIPDAMLLTEQDIRASEAALTGASAVVVQLQQPPAAALAAARIAATAAHQPLVVLDGVATNDVLPHADVIRADDNEARLLTGRSLDQPDEVVHAARELLDRIPRLRLVAFGAGEHGNVFVWPDGNLVLPLEDVPVADTTGGGDSFVAALTLGLIRGDEPETAAAAAVAAAAQTVRHAGGRPALRRGTHELL
ncbi:MAG TPA: PfkB family carbohydrate kinase [Pseudonocardiaceae bacterium]|nr:PfkB family carbohydrate kinase [Pseudonocardiaceae bacterium]